MVKLNSFINCIFPCSHSRRDAIRSKRASMFLSQKSLEEGTFFISAGGLGPYVLGNVQEVVPRVLRELYTLGSHNFFSIKLSSISHNLPLFFWYSPRYSACTLRQVSLFVASYSIQVVTNPFLIADHAEAVTTHR